MVRSRQFVSARRPLKWFTMVRSDTDSSAGVWNSEEGKYVKPAGDIDGVTLQESRFPRNKAKYQAEPVGLGDIDGYGP